MEAAAVSVLDKIRELERLSDPDQQDYLSALRERIHPIRGKASLGEGLSYTHYNNIDPIFADGYGYGSHNSYGLGEHGNGYGSGCNEYGHFFGSDGFSDRNGEGSASEIPDQDFLVVLAWVVPEGVLPEYAE